MSEEFGGALPSVMIAELQRLPAGFMEQLIEYRRFAEAKAANDANLNGWETSEMRTIAMKIDLELAQEEADRKARAADA